MPLDVEHTQDDMTVPERLREAREENGLSRAALARKVNLSPKLIENIEAGRQRAPFDVVVRLATALDLPIGELVGEVIQEDPDPIVPPKRSRLEKPQRPFRDVRAVAHEPEDELSEDERAAIEFDSLVRDVTHAVDEGRPRGLRTAARALFAKLETLELNQLDYEARERGFPHIVPESPVKPEDGAEYHEACENASYAFLAFSAYGLDLVELAQTPGKLSTVADAINKGPDAKRGPFRPGEINRGLFESRQEFGARVIRKLGEEAHEGRTYKLPNPRPVRGSRS